jgi:hypothetical protein
MEDLEKKRNKKGIFIRINSNSIRKAYKRDYEDSEESNVKIILDSETGEIHVYAEKNCC